MISVIVCSIDPGKFQRVRANYSALLAGESFEIIGIHDARSLAEAYNRAFRQSKGSILVFSHDDIRIHSADFAAKLRRHLREFDLVGPAGNSQAIDGYWANGDWRHIHGQVAHTLGEGYEVMMCDCGRAALQGKSIVGGVQLLDGVFMAARRPVLEKVAFDAQAFDGFHGYDVDFSFAAHLAGFRIGVFNDIAIVHESRGTYDETWKRYARAFADKYRGRLAPPVPQDPRNVWLQLPCRTEAELLAAFQPDFQRAQGQRFHAQPHLDFEGFAQAPGGGSLLKDLLMSLLRRRR